MTPPVAAAAQAQPSLTNALLKPRSGQQHIHRLTLVRRPAAAAASDALEVASSGVLWGHVDSGGEPSLIVLSVPPS
eukprot:CAMPEP_0173455648 /NCGR_PEP_ID=MMETSP1357-20121228/54651_1 /TAXON_ID=77926 /ORGANISM="Hemiselmis rufescens, Strain PCC563" /LENGTH=75 /DNA_ID=CAMNT_0014422801 /DNA_START=41 /DNA_END=264 /DNA_ORIENTATION=-